MADESTLTTEEVTEDTTDETEDTTEDTSTDSTDETTDETDDTEQTLLEELIEDLTAELSIADVNFNATLLASKIKAAIRDVKRVRHYPNYYTDDQIDSDLYNYYSNCRAIALNDYNKIGIENESYHTESSVSASFTDRDKLFAGIIPLSR